MKKYQSVGLSIIVLTSVIVGTLLWLVAFSRSIDSYRSPLRGVSIDPQETTPPYTHKVVLVIISGLGYDNALALNLPMFERLRQTGAEAAVQSEPPTYTQTAWATLISGAPPETNDAPPVQQPTEALYPLEVDTLFNRARQAGYQTALFGHADWERLIPAEMIDQKFFLNASGAQVDELLLETAMPAIKDNETELVILQFTQLEFAAGQLGGLEGPAYRQAADQINAYLEKISSAIDLSDAVLIVTADHGLTEDGGHGGNEVEVIWQPVVMIGENVVPGSYSDIHQTDLAPTIATLLGLAPPTLSQGRILAEMLRLSQVDQAVLQLNLARQKMALTRAYAAQVGGEGGLDLTSLAEDLTYAEATFENDNINGALQLALLAQQEAEAQMSAIRHSRLQTGQLLRLPLVVLIIAVWFIGLWRKRGAHSPSIIIAATITIVLYHTLYQLQGYSYSISSYLDFSSLPLEIARRTSVSLLIGWGLLLILLMLADEGNWIRLLGSAYGFSVLVTFIFMLPFFWGYWQNGWAVTSTLPAVGPIFWQISGAVESLVAAALGLLLPWPIMALCLFLYIIRHRLNETESSRTKTGALPGLRL